MIQAQVFPNELRHIYDRKFEQNIWVINLAGGSKMRIVYFSKYSKKCGPTACAIIQKECLFVCLSVCLFVCLSVCLFVFLSVCLSVFLSVFLSACVICVICVSCLCLSVSVCLSVCLSVSICLMVLIHENVLECVRCLDLDLETT